MARSPLLLLLSILALGCADVAATPADSGPRAVLQGDAGVPEACSGTSPRCDEEPLIAAAELEAAAHDVRAIVPLLRAEHDLVSPAMHGDLLVYLSNEDGQYDVWGMHMGMGRPFRITDSAEDERALSVRGTAVAYVRGEGERRRAYLYDLVLGEERALSDQTSDSPALGAADEVVWTEYDGAQWDLWIEWPRGAAARPLHQPGGLAGDQRAPGLEAGSVHHAVYLADERPHYSEWPDNFLYEIAHHEPIPGAVGPFFNLVGRCWTDGRHVTDAADERDDWDVYCARLGGPSVSAEHVEPWASGPGAQIVESVGTWIGYRDGRDGNWDVGVGLPGGAGERITTHPADQRNLVSGHDWLVWQDARNGSWDLYATRRPFPGESEEREAPIVSFAEAGPDYVELSLAGWQRGRGDLGGARLLVDGRVRHVFADGARVRGERLVVTDGEPAAGAHFAGAEVQRADALGLDRALDRAQVVLSLESRDGVELARAGLRTDGESPGW
ncbi:MAG TPA: hypothetical protein DEF51_11685 [Myxococcales bacterium]|mgnify:FL=1|nr:hypothetical protein [Myxococcales bacterium]